MFRNVLDAAASAGGGHRGQFGASREANAIRSDNILPGLVECQMQPADWQTGAIAAAEGHGNVGGYMNEALAAAPERWREYLPGLAAALRPGQPVRRTEHSVRPANVLSARGVPRCDSNRMPSDHDPAVACNAVTSSLTRAHHLHRIGRFDRHGAPTTGQVPAAVIA